MAITTLDGYLNAAKYNAVWFKTGTRTTVAGVPFTTAGVAGNPVGTLNAGNTANGVVPTDDGTEGPALPAISNSAYLTRVMCGSTVATTFRVYDRLFACGAYAYNANTTLSSIPSYSGRIPTGGYYGLEIWHEAVTNHTTNTVIQVNYLDQDGNAGDTGQVAMGLAPILGRMFRIPLASGDSGVQGLTQIRQTGATAGTFNISVMRPLWSGRISVAYDQITNDFLKTGMPQIYATSCLWVVIETDSTAVGLPWLGFQVADG
jgi:hypothetical protein